MFSVWLLLVDALGSHGNFIGVAQTWGIYLQKKTQDTLPIYLKQEGALFQIAKHSLKDFLALVQVR